MWGNILQISLAPLILTPSRLPLVNSDVPARLTAPTTGERNMQKIDFKKLLGFETVAATVSNFDFRDETVGSKLGAKIGGGEPTSPKGIDFQDETLGAKLGAKVGEPEPV